MKKNIFINTGLFSTILFLLFIFLELFVRLFVDNGFNYELEMLKYSNKLKMIRSAKNKEEVLIHRPNSYEKLMKVNVFTDENGFRFNPQIKNKNKNKIKKILMLGDSMTMGWGAENTFSDYLILKSNKRLSVLNSGVGNTNTIMQISSFFSFYKKVDADIIILNFFINDFENINLKKSNFLLKNFYSLSFLKYRLYLLGISFKKNSNYKSFYKETFKNIDIKNRTFQLIQELNEYSIKNNKKFIVNFIPELRNLENYEFEDEYNFLKSFLKEKQIPFADARLGLKNYYGMERHLWVSPEDTHGNDNFHKSVANYLLKYLKNNNFIK